MKAIELKRSILHPSQVIILMPLIRLALFLLIRLIQAILP
jgi:hypothetical protein